MTLLLQYESHSLDKIRKARTVLPLPFHYEWNHDVLYFLFIFSVICSNSTKFVFNYIVRCIYTSPFLLYYNRQRTEYLCGLTEIEICASTNTKLISKFNHAHNVSHANMMWWCFKRLHYSNIFHFITDNSLFDANIINFRTTHNCGCFFNLVYFTDNMLLYNEYYCIFGFLMTSLYSFRFVFIDIVRVVQFLKLFCYIIYSCDVYLMPSLVAT